MNSSNNGNPAPNKRSKKTTIKSPKSIDAYFPELLDTTNENVKTIISYIDKVSQMEIDSLYIMAQQRKMLDDQKLVHLNTIRKSLKKIRDILQQYNQTANVLTLEQSKKVIDDVLKAETAAKLAAVNIKNN
jgi:hypothetical protein